MDAPTAPSGLLAEEGTTLAGLLLKQGGSMLAEFLEQGLTAAGVRLVTAASTYDVVTEAERAGGAFQYLVLGVDYFGKEEFALLPLARREWPRMGLVVYHSPGFEYKGRLAELCGAETVLANAEDIQGFLESLSPEPAPAQTVQAEREAPAATAPPERARAPQEEPSLPPEARAYLASGATTCPPEQTEQRPPAAVPSEAQQGSEPTPEAQASTAQPEKTAELTKEELRILLGEEDDE